MTVKDADSVAKEATAVIGAPSSQREIFLLFQPEHTAEFARLVGRRATVLGRAMVSAPEHDDKVVVDGIDVKAVEDGPTWMTITELLVSTNDWPPTRVDVSKWPMGFDFDVDEFLETIYEGRGRTWAESKIDWTSDSSSPSTC